MKGLFLNNFYSAIGNMKLFMCIVFVMGAALLVTGNATILELFVYIAITAFSINGVAGLRKSSTGKWDKYELTLPVRRKDIVASKFLSYLFWIAIGTIVSLVFVGAATAIHGTMGFFTRGLEDFISMALLGIGISMMSGAIFYPISYIFGIEKSDTLLRISIIMSIGLVILIIYALNKFLPIHNYIRLGIFAAFYSLMYIISYFVTLNIYNSKDL